MTPPRTHTEEFSASGEAQHEHLISQTKQALRSLQESISTLSDHTSDDNNEQQSTIDYTTLTQFILGLSQCCFQDTDTDLADQLTSLHQHLVAGAIPEQDHFVLIEQALDALQWDASPDSLPGVLTSFIEPFEAELASHQASIQQQEQVSPIQTISQATDATNIVVENYLSALPDWVPSHVIKFFRSYLTKKYIDKEPVGGVENFCGKALVFICGLLGPLGPGKELLAAIEKKVSKAIDQSPVISGAKEKAKEILDGTDSGNDTKEKTSEQEALLASLGEKADQKSRAWLAMAVKKATGLSDQAFNEKKEQIDCVLEEWYQDHGAAVRSKVLGNTELRAAVERGENVSINDLELSLGTFMTHIKAPFSLVQRLVAADIISYEDIVWTTAEKAGKMMRKASIGAAGLLGNTVGWLGGMVSLEDINDHIAGYQLDASSRMSTYAMLHRHGGPLRMVGRLIGGGIGLLTASSIGDLPQTIMTRFQHFWHVGTGMHIQGHLKQIERLHHTLSHSPIAKDTVSRLIHHLKISSAAMVAAQQCLKNPPYDYGNYVKHFKAAIASVGGKSFDTKLIDKHLSTLKLMMQENIYKGKFPLALADLIKKDAVSAKSAFGRFGFVDDVTSTLRRFSPIKYQKQIIAHIDDFTTHVCGQVSAEKYKIGKVFGRFMEAARWSKEGKLLDKARIYLGTPGDAKAFFKQLSTLFAQSPAAARLLFANVPLILIGNEVMSEIKDGKPWVATACKGLQSVIPIIGPVAMFHEAFDKSGTGKKETNRTQVGASCAFFTLDSVSLIRHAAAKSLRESTRNVAKYMATPLIDVAKLGHGMYVGTRLIARHLYHGGKLAINQPAAFADELVKFAQKAGARGLVIATALGLTAWGSKYLWDQATLSPAEEKLLDGLKNDPAKLEKELQKTRTAMSDTEKETIMRYAIMHKTGLQNAASLNKVHYKPSSNRFEASIDIRAFNEYFVSGVEDLSTAIKRFQPTDTPEIVFAPSANSVAAYKASLLEQYGQDQQQCITHLLQQGLTSEQVSTYFGWSQTT